MNIKKLNMHGGLSTTMIIFIVFIVAVSAYAFINNKVDSHAEEMLASMVIDAKSQGIDISYDTVDTSPIARSITLQNFKISGGEQEPDIILGNMVISGLNWQALSNQDRIPLSMTLKITGGEIHLTESMVGDDPDLQAFVDVMGSRLSFSTYANYHLDEATGLFTATIVQAVNDNFNVTANLALGNTGWLASIDTNESLLSDNLTLDLLSTTLNGLSITFKNEGIIEKIRVITVKKTGLSNEQLIQQSVLQLRQVQSSLHEWNPVYSLMIEELIKFTEQPNQLIISIDPEQPLVSDDFLKVFIGSQSAPFDLMKKAQLFIRAN